MNLLSEKGYKEIMDNIDTIEFSEEDCNVLYGAVISQISNNKWDPLDEVDWQNLTNLKDMQHRLERLLDGR